MAHLAARSGYRELVQRLNKGPQGAPPSELLFQILQILMSEKEAALVALVPFKPFTAKTAARAWKMNEAEAQKALDGLASRALLVDIEGRRNRYYVLPPPMAGFFEFSLMRLRGDVDQKLLAQLYYQYITVEEDFIKALFTRGETQLGRTFVNEEVLSNENALHVLDYERASEVVKTASHRGIGLCYCRHKMEHAGHACDAPLDICMTFNTTAASLIRHGYARAVDVAEGLALLQRGPRPQPRPVRGEHQDRGQLHLQLLRLLLRGHDRPAPLRPPEPRPHDELPSGRRPVHLHGLRRMRGRLSGGGHDPGLGQRPAPPQEENGQGR